MVARRILHGVFSRIGFRTTSIKVVFADGSVFESHPGEPEPDIRITFKTTQAEWRACLFFYEGLFEKYIDCEIDIEGERPIAKLAAVGREVGIDGRFGAFGIPLRNPISIVRQLAQEWRQRNTDRQRSIRNAEYHYALHPALFEHMLGATVGYSEGLWTGDTRTLDQAKVNNYEYVCGKLKLEPGLRVLEVGGGWGFMAIHMVKQHDVEVTMVNPVARQNDYMRERFRRHGVEGRIRLVEGDHRDIAKEAGAFDRFVSIGVHEHAGLPIRQYRLWANAIAAALKDDGIGVVSTTTLMARRMTEMLTLKYIFPGGHVPSLPTTLSAFADAGLTLIEVENLWPHYQRTIDEWCRRFEQYWPEIQKADPAAFTESFRRKWLMWLEGTYDVFSNGLDLSHILFAKGRNPAHSLALPERQTPLQAIGGDEQPDPYPL